MTFHYAGGGANVAVNSISDPEALRFYSALVDGWGLQLRAKGNRPLTINASLRHIALFRRFVENRYPWEWTGLDVDRFGAHLAQRVRSSTLRGYQLDIKHFLDYATDSVYDWNDECDARFGHRMRQLCKAENTVVHRWADDDDPRRRALTSDEVSKFFVCLRDRMTAAVASGRKGAASAARDYALFATALGWGLRAREVARLEMFDLAPHADSVIREAFGRYSVLHVRWGKARRQGSPQHRPVLAVPLFAPCVEALRWYLENVRPTISASKRARTALWLTERGDMVPEAYVSLRFSLVCKAAELPDYLSLHCLRHTYGTRLVEAGYPDAFIQSQLGHTNADTTGIYTKPSEAYRTRVVRGFQRYALAP